MTFTILGRCARTGQLGGAVTTSDLAVGARVLWAGATLGVAATQHRTDPRLGPLLLDALASGRDPDGAIAAVVAGTAERGWRQLGVLDAGGRAAAYCGERLSPIGAALAGEDCLVLGNMLVSGEVAPAMVRAFGAGRDGADRDGGGCELAARLLAALRAGRDAGGETGALRSAALLVVERESFPFIDLRVDDDPDPVGRLAALQAAYGPRARAFVARALDPDGVHESSSTTTEAPHRRAG
jgi:uncharacterized Ntn-hydrolase superfamily protein